MNFIKRQYAQAWSFYKTALRRRFWICMAVFLVLCGVSALILSQYSAKAMEIMTDFMSDVASSGVLDEDGNIGALGLFENNLRATLMAAALGIVPFLFLPALVLVTNAVIIGALLGLWGALGGAVWKVILLGLLPHGIFEIPAIILGVAMGLYLCRSINAAIRKKPDAPRLEAVIPQLVRQAILVVIPLLAAAAVIEAYVTPSLFSGGL